MTIRNKPGKRKPHEIAREAVEAFKRTGKEEIPSDVQGSYTGSMQADPHARPVQDADDL